MQHTIHGTTMNDLMTKTVERFLTIKEPDVNASIESHLLNVHLYADEARFAFDIGKDMWLNVGRWSRLIKEYLPRSNWEVFLESAKQIYANDCRDGAATSMMFRDPVRKAKKHRWGGCLLSAVFTHRPGKDPLLTFNSRTCYIGYMGMLDACIAAVMARRISGLKAPPISFAWNLASMQFHGFKSLPFLFTQPKLIKPIAEDAKLFKHGPKSKEVQVLRESLSPTRFILSRWYYTILRDYREYGEEMCAHQKYGPLKRVMRRWLEWKGLTDTPIPPSLPVHELTFDKAE